MYIKDLLEGRKWITPKNSQPSPSVYKRKLVFFGIFNKIIIFNCCLLNVIEHLSSSNKYQCYEEKDKKMKRNKKGQEVILCY